MPEVSQIRVSGTLYDIKDTVARLSSGAPATAATVSAMTDSSKVYVYTGSESGYTKGNWYYFDGSSWVSGGVYNSAAVETDTSLSASGAPADAKAVGDRISEMQSQTSQQITKNGVTDAIRAALMDIANHVVWDDTDPTGRTYIDALYSALYPSAAQANASSASVQQSKMRTASLLSATKRRSAQVIDSSLYNWDFTQSLVDSKHGRSAVLQDTNVRQNSDGLFYSGVGVVYFGGLNGLKAFTIEIDVTRFINLGTGNTLVLTFANEAGGAANGGLGFSTAAGWRFRDSGGAWHDLSGGTRSEDGSVFDGRTMRIEIDQNNQTYSLYAGDLFVGSTAFATQLTNKTGFNVCGNGFSTNKSTIYTGLRLYEGLANRY